MAVAPPPIASPHWGEKFSEGAFFKVFFFQKVRCVFHIAEINIPNHYPELEI